MSSDSHLWFQQREASTHAHTHIHTCPCLCTHTNRRHICRASRRFCCKQYALSAPNWLFEKKTFGWGDNGPIMFTERRSHAFFHISQRYYEYLGTLSKVWFILYEVLEIFTIKKSIYQMNASYRKLSFSLSHSVNQAHIFISHIYIYIYMVWHRSLENFEVWISLLKEKKIRKEIISNWGKFLWCLKSHVI